MKYVIIIILLTFSISSLWADEQINAQIQAEYEELDYSFDEPFIKLNPFGKNELSALIRFPTERPAQIQLTIQGRDNTEDLVHTFKEYKTEHTIPVLGLYPDYNNQITLTALYENGESQTKKLSLKTEKLNKRALIVIENKIDNVTRYHYLHDGVVFDENGWIRLSFKNENQIVYWFNGELIAEDRNMGLTRYSLLGEKLQHYPFPEKFVSFAHGIGQKPNGNFLVIGSFGETKALFEGEQQITQREFVIELDYHTGKLVNTIDFAEIANPNRSVIIKSATQNYGMNDWCHINSVDYDASDNGIVISCRHVGILKADEKTKELSWIFSMHKGFDISGRNGKGPALYDKLLTAVDNNNQPYNDNIQKGIEKSNDFKWPAKTHHAKVLGNNLLSVFDNAGSLYDKTLVTTDTSNASVYKIDSQNKTVQQIWFQSLPWRADSASSVLYRPQDNEVIVYASTVKDKNQTGISYGKLIRYEMNTHKPLFEATVYRGGETYFYRVDDFEFYLEK